MKKQNSSATWWIVYTSRYLFPVSLLWVLLIPIHTLVFFCPFFPSYTLLCRISFFPIVLLHICTLIHPTLNAQEFFRLYQGTFDPIDFKGKVNKCACLQPSNSYSLIHVQNKNTHYKISRNTLCSGAGLPFVQPFLSAQVLNHLLLTLGL